MVLTLGGQKIGLGGPPRRNDTSENPVIHEHVLVVVQSNPLVMRC